MGNIYTLYQKGNYVETPYFNFYEIKARLADEEKSLKNMSDYKKKVLLVVNISPYDKNWEKEYDKLIELKKSIGENNEKFEILAFPSAQLDRVEVSDREMREKLKDRLGMNIGSNSSLIWFFNRVYLNGFETSEIFKFCYRNSEELYMHHAGKSKLLEKNFSKFLISNNGIVHAYYTPDVDIKEIEENVEYLIAQRPKKIDIRDDFINYNKYY